MDGSNIQYGLSQAIGSHLVSDDPLDAYNVVRDDDGNVCEIHSDITTLLQSTKMTNELDKQDISDYLASIQSSDTSLSSAFKSLSDDQLFQFIKPRRCQSFSELKVWSQYLDEEMTKALDGVKEEQKQSKLSAFLKRKFGVDSDGNFDDDDEL